MFLINDERTKLIYQKAFRLISESNNSEAIQNLVNDMVAKGNQYKQFNFDKVVINLMRQMVQSQKAKNVVSLNPVAMMEFDRLGDVLSSFFNY